MKQVVLFIFFLSTEAFFGQSVARTYQFKADIENSIKNDSAVWKYQTGATQFAFSGYYQEVLNTWDKNGSKKPKTTLSDSLFFVNSQKVNAKDYIIDQAKNNTIVIINEAHHLAKHRKFTTSMLQDLYDIGYRYFGVEALFDAEINDRKYPTQDSGYYTKEPEFGNLLAEALKIGFTLFGYEANELQNAKQREIEQAQNIQTFIKNNPPGKVIIYCGYAHAFENDYPAWEKAMAARLKEATQIDPFTIDQTMILERANPQNNHLFMRLNTTDQPLVLISNNGLVYRGASAKYQTDVVLIYPETNVVNQRPSWLVQNRVKHSVILPENTKDSSFLVLAYRENEFQKNGIPADIIEINSKTDANNLYLAKGNYWIVIQDKNYDVVKQYLAKI